MCVKHTKGEMGGEGVKRGERVEGLKSGVNQKRSRSSAREDRGMVVVMKPSSCDGNKTGSDD